MRTPTLLLVVVLSSAPHASPRPEGRGLHTRGLHTRGLHTLGLHTWGTELPDGWKVRFDDASAKPADVLVEEKDGSLTFTTGPAGIYYKGDKAQNGFDYTATFSQLKPTAMAEAYGLFIAGQDLDKDTQRYTYFLIRQDGKYTIKTRNGSATKAIVDWTDAPSMKEPKGVKTSNTLEIRATANSVQFVVDSKPVHSMTRDQVGPDGAAGVRINHNLNVQVSKLEIKKLP